MRLTFLVIWLGWVGFLPLLRAQTSGVGSLPPPGAAPTPPLAEEAPTRPSQAELREVRGRVWLRREGESWQPARPGTELFRGDRLRADRRGRAEFRYWDGVEVVLEPDSMVEVLDRAAPEDEALKLLLGEVLVDIRRSSPESSASTEAIPFRIRTPRAVAGAEGTRFRVRVGGQGVRVAVLRGKVRVEETEGEGERLLGPSEQIAVGRRGRLTGSRPLALPWVAAPSGLARREAAEEPFFGEIGRFRSLRYLSLVDPRRDALANPARVRRLLAGEGFEILEGAVSGRQGESETLDRTDLTGVRHLGGRDRSEASEAGDLFRYQALDDGRWALAWRLQGVNLRGRVTDSPSLPPGPLVGQQVLRQASLEGEGLSAQLQRSWQRGKDLWGVGFLQHFQDLDGVESYHAPGVVERASTRVLDRRQVTSLGFSRDLPGARDLGLVLRFQEREVDRSERSRERNGLGVPLADRLLLDQYTVGLDALWRRHLAPGREVALRAFFERARAQRFEGVDVDPTRFREEDELSERTHLYGLGLGWIQRPRRDTLLSLDLGWQRLDRSADLLRAGREVLVVDDRESRTGLHLGFLRQFPQGDARLSYELARVHRDEHFLPVGGAGVPPPPGTREDAWRTRFGLTLGRWLGRSRRLEFEVEEREQESPERLVRLRLLRSF